MDADLESKCKVECKIATIIAAYSGPAFCQFPKRTHKAVVHATPIHLRHSAKNPGTLRQAWESYTAVFGIRAGTVAFMKGMK